MNNITPIGPLGESRPVQHTPGVAPRPKDVPSFKETLNGFLSDVNDLQQKASESIQKLTTGEITDVHQVMNAAEEANVAFNMMMEIRNKVMDAYQEVMRLRL